MRHLPYYNLLGDREAKTANSETYKKYIRAYLEAKGHRFISDSKVEGHLPDLIFIDNETEIDREIWIEAKWSDFSFNDSSFLEEFLGYTLSYFYRIPEDRFRLMIFARNTKNQVFHKSLLNKLSNEEILSIITKIIPLTKDDKDKELLLSLTIDDLKGFFGKIDLYQSDIDSLKIKIDQIYNEEFDPSNIFSNYQNLKEELYQEKKEEYIISNLVQLTNIDKIWQANTSIRTKDEIFSKIKYAPPFLLFEGKLISLYSFNRKNNLLNFVDETSIEEIDIVDWIQERDKHNTLIYLLNTTANKLCRHRGLYTDNKGRWFYPLQYPKYLKRSVRWKKGSKLHSRDVASVRMKEQKINFCYHLSVVITTKIINSDIYYCILPQKTFTTDGKTPVSVNDYERIERGYRKSIMGYNPNALNDICFWYYVLFEHFDIFTDPLTQTDFQRENQFHTRRILRTIDPQKLKEIKINRSPIENSFLLKKFEKIVDNELLDFPEEQNENQFNRRI